MDNQSDRYRDQRNTILLKNRYSPFKGERVGLQIRLTSDLAKHLERDRQKLAAQTNGVPSVSFVVERALREHYGLPLAG